MSTNLRAALEHGEVRRVITNAYYDARNEGETMEVAADRAADAVMALATTPERCPRCGVRGDDPGMIAEGAVGATRCPRCGKWNRNSSATPEPAPALLSRSEVIDHPLYSPGDCDCEATGIGVNEVRVRYSSRCLSHAAEFARLATKEQT